MNDHYPSQHPSPASSSSSAPVAYQGRRRHTVEEDAGDPVTCTGKSCQSCTAGVVADCVAVCCCPCAVVDILALAFFKLPWAVARKLIGRGKRRSGRRRMLEEKRNCCGEDRNGISQRRRVEDGTSEIVLEEVNDDFSAEFKADEVWLELYEVGQIGHMGFGRVSFTGIPFHDKGN